MQPVYLAPLEGVTDAVFRREHAARFGGVAKYFIPFISPTQNLRMTPRELAAVSPQENAGLFAVPQVLAREPAHFLWAMDALADMGYGEVNLNLGCPSGTATAKGKGAGMLRDLDALARFLDAVCAHGAARLSVKTRLGWADPSEFGALLSLLSRYPLCEVIVHARTREEFYGGAPHRDVFAAALPRTRLPLVYNGDLFSARDCRALSAACPGASALMLGRGLIADPAIARERSGGSALTDGEMRDFVLALLDGWRARHPLNVALARANEVLKYAARRYDAPEKALRQLRKARTPQAFAGAMEALLACPHRAE